MTQEGKAKRFDEALAMAKECITYVPDDAVNKYMLNMFPELKESEGEKIRKVLIGWINLEPSTSFNDTFDGFSKEQILAWIEKQGQTFTKKDVDDAYLKGVCDTKHELEKQCDASHQQRVEDAMQEVEEKAKIFTEAFQGKTSEEILAEMRGEQKPIEWSTEDEKMAERLLGWLDTLANYIHYDAIVSLDLRRERMQQVQQLKTWLKSLRPQKQWKPSDEQMKALNAINVTGCISYAGQGQELINLYNELKKLKG